MNISVIEPFLPFAGGYALFVTGNLQIARLTSTKITSAGKPLLCFKFWYHMNIEDRSELTVYKRTLSEEEPKELALWLLSGNQGNQWRQARVPIHGLDAYQVNIWCSGLPFNIGFQRLIRFATLHCR